ncbi:MAG TPA: phospho-N-acetylmuramoyl-pentapeptide-transferase, partial [Thermomicrobiales bacterium]|nr:phospho-N-acetylmuramoyl-pentapeptide-transferase [Thermomicrobiales bacterium]
MMLLAGLVLPLAGIGEIMPHDGDENMAVSLALAGLSFLVTMIVGRPMITWLRQHGIGKKIRMELTQHMDKAGTPTMGGLMFIFTGVLMTLIFNTAGRLSMLLPLGVLVSVGALGAVDDKMNLVEGKGEGMSGRFKMLWLVIIAVISAFVLHLPDPWGLGLHHIYIPYFGRFDIGWIYLPIAAFAIVSMANAVNLTDGLDSLAAGTAAVAFVSYGIIAYQQGQTAVVTFCFIMVGALMGFLWFNAPPAQVFMGDTGSLALGASLAVAAFMTGQWLLLPVVGGVFVAETLSVMLQTSWCKFTRKRFGEPR